MLAHFFGRAGDNAADDLRCRQEHSPQNPERSAASGLLGYDPDHFRKQIEPKLIAELAVTVHRDLLRYKSRAKRAPASLEPTGDTPSLNEAHFTHQEELVSRIW